MLLRGLTVVALLDLLASPVTAEPAEPQLGTGLGKVVDGCKTASLAGSTDCLALGDGWALLKDLRGETQFLVVARDAGDRLGHYDQPEPKLWSAAWAARACVQEIAREIDHRIIPLDNIGVMMNSRFGASQDRQHIHVDAIYPERLNQLMEAYAVHAGDAAKPWTVSLGGTSYSVVQRAGIDDQQIFADMAHSPLGPSTAITEAVIAIPGGKGVLELTGEANGLGTGSAENDLQVPHPPLDNHSGGPRPEHDRRSHCAEFKG
jgi:CDP-diacylglycerol pyrophosphatase